MRRVACICAASLLLSSCSQDALLGTWEVDAEKTIAQYQTVPKGYESLSLAEFKQLRRGELEGRVYRLTRQRPKQPDWGDTNFQGIVEASSHGNVRFYGAWRLSTNQPGSVELFAYTLNSGASYWPAGRITIDSNGSSAAWHPSGDADQAVFLRKARH